MRSILSWFSFYGRSRRSSYAIYFAISVAAYLVMSGVFFVWSIKLDRNEILEKMQRADPKTGHLFDWAEKIPSGLVTGAMIVSAIVLLILYVAWVALCVRRLHDMKVTGWLVLLCIVVALVPYAGYLLVSLVLGLWPGSKGHNGYGGNPRLPSELADVFGPGPDRQQRVEPSMR